jgi:O-antigen/teichoic acid export membrane protein
MVALVGSHAGGLALAFCISILIGRLLGPAGLGRYAAVLAWILPLSVLVEGGIGTLMTQGGAKEPSMLQGYVDAAARFHLLAGGGAILLIWALATTLARDATIAAGLRLAAPLVLFGPLFGILTALFRATRRTWPIPWLNLGMLSIQLALTAVVLLRGGGVIAAIAVNVASSAARLLAAWNIYRLRYHLPSSAPAVAVGPLVRKGLPIALAAFLTGLQVRLGVVFLERLSNPAEIGLFSASIRFIEVARLIPNAFLGAILPALGTIALQPARVMRLLSHAMNLLLGFGLLVALLFTWGAPHLLGITYGPAFASGATTLQIASWSLVPFLLRSVRTLHSLAAGQHARVRNVNGIALLLQLAAGVWLIPSHGAVGAAAAILIAESAAFFLLWGGGPSTRKESRAGS